MINQKQKTVIKLLLLRPNMYLGKDPCEENIVLFIDGMESMMDSCQDENCLSFNINIALSEKKIYGGSLGWPFAIQKYANKTNITWFEAFCKICNELFSNEEEKIINK